MGVITALVIGAVVVGAAVASAVVQKNAADKAADAQKKAVAKQAKLLKSLDPHALNTLATEFDKTRAKARLDFQREIDPELADLRQKSKEQLLQEASVNPEDRKSGQLAQTLFDEVKTQDPRMEALKQSLITNAQQELDAGATLPPEFQAELVRSGLTKGSQAGIALDKNNIGGTTARLLGIAGLQLKQQQQDQAIRLEQAANEITNSRVNILATVFPKLRDLETVNRDEAARNLALSNSLLPEVGLSGQDAVNIQIAKTKGQAGLAQQRGNIAAGQAIAEGNYQSALIGAAAKGVTSAAGGIGGGGGAAGGFDYSSLISSGGGVSGNAAPAGTTTGYGQSYAPNTNANYYANYLSGY